MGSSQNTVKIERGLKFTDHYEFNVSPKVPKRPRPVHKSYEFSKNF